MTMTSVANTQVRTASYPTVDLIDGVLKITGSGNVLQLDEIAKKISDYRKSHPEIINIEVDVSQVSGQTPNTLIPLLMTLRKKNKENIPRITGLTEDLLQSNVVKPLLNQIDMSAGGRKYVSLRVAKSPEPTTTCFSLEVESNTLTFLFSANKITSEDTANMINTARGSLANVIIDLRNCTKLETDSVLAIILVHNNLKDNRSLKVILKKDSNPEIAINDFIAKRPYFSKSFGERVSV